MTTNASSSKRSISHYLMGAVLINILTLLAFIALNLYTLDFFRRSQATDLVKSIRNDLLLGDRARAFSLLGARRGPDQTFVAIELNETQSKSPIMIGDRYRDSFRNSDVGNFLYYGQIEVPLNYGGQSDDSAGHLVFYYDRFANISVTLYVWVVLCLVLFAWAVRSYRFTLVLMEERVAARRHETIAQMAQMLSHDLRSPLNAVERILHLLPGSSLEPETKNLRLSLNQIYSLIESMRYMDSEARLQCSQHLVSFDRGIVGLLQKATVQGIDLDYPKETSITAVIDQQKFERAWVNLVSNALDFASSTVSIELFDMDATLVLRVIDDGPGVSKDFLPNLFKRGATHGKEDGTGLGLAYVRQIMRGHGGDVAYRREGELTVFECRLPGAVVKDRVQTLSNVIEISSEQKTQMTVAICLNPSELTTVVLERMTQRNSKDFLFSQHVEGAQFVVGNQQQLMVEIGERGEQEYVSVAQMKGDADRIASFLCRKFNIN